jgi:outer membrane protein OmpA-like peptidoglycan-associated protein
MQKNASKSLSTKKKIIRRIWFWVLIGLMGVGVLFFTLLPVGMDYGIERYLKDQGADQATLEDVDFNPITGRMTLTNLNIITDGQTVLKIPQATLRIRWTPFVRKRFVLERLIITDTELIVQTLKDGHWQIGGIKLPDKKETSEPSAWNFGFQQVTVKNSNIKLITPQLSSELKIEQAKISKLRSWLPERSAQLEFKGQLNDGILDLQLDISPFRSEIMAAGRIKLKGLNLNPFSHLLQPNLKTLEGHLDLDVNIETRQSTGVGLRHQQKGSIGLHQIRTQIEDTNLSKENLAWNGTIKVNIPEPQESLEIVADGQLSGSTLNMDIENEKLKVQQGNFSWKGKLDYGQDKTGQKITADGQISLVDLKVASPQFNLFEEKLTWQGPVELSSDPDAVNQRIIADGQLNGAALSLNIENEKLKFQQNEFSWKGKIDYAQDKANRKIKSDGQISLVDLKVASPQFDLSEEKLTWQGPLELLTTANSENQRIIADGALDSSHLQLNLLNRKLKSEHKGLSWKGRLDSGEKNDYSSLKAEADFSLKDIEILQSETSQHLFNLDQAGFQAIQIEGLDKISVSSIALNGLALLAELKTAQSSGADPTLLRMQALEVKDVRLSQQKNLTIESINLNAMKIFVQRNPEGKLTAIERLSAVQSDGPSTDQSKPAASATRTKAKSGDYGFRIGQVEITGDSKLRFKDESVSPAFSIDIGLLEAHLADLDNRRPEKPATIKLLISDGKDGRLSLDGTMQPFSEQLSLDWVGKIKSLDLPLLSPYVIQNTGYRFISGDLQADIPLKISQNQLEGKIDLILYKPKVARVKPEDSSEEKRGKIQLDMSLDSALKLLRDDQNNVKLNIPVSGDIHDPQFSVADAINKVLAKTLQKSALSYLKFMLGPYGIGISVAEFAYEQATKIRLNPIMFAPGNADLDEAAVDYLKRVAAIMKEYPMVRVNVCGVATESDRAAMNQNASTDEALLTLAKSRTERIEDQLVKLNSIESNRIIACEPDIDKTADARPRADLEI